MNFTWEIKRTETVSEDSLENVISAIHWIAEKNGVSIYGEQALDKPDLDLFIPFDKIDNEILISWIENKINTIQIESTLDGILLQSENI